MPKLTKTQIHENFNKRYQQSFKDREKRDEAFKELQELSASVGKPRYCCAATNLAQLIGTTHEGRAFYLYDTYVEIEAKHDLMLELYFQILDPKKENKAW